jgi:putative Mn2+ efflux pump MntP
MTDTVYLGPMVTLLLVAAALGINNFAGSIGIGVSGAGRAVRVRVAVVFGVFETAMPIIGLLGGRDVASGLGSAARWTGAGLLAAVGVYELIGAIRSHGDSGSGAGLDQWSGWRLVVSGAALSLDNLAVGFALGAVDVPVVVAVIVFGVVSVAMSMAGLELGAKLGTAVGDNGRIIAGIALLGVGGAMAAGWLLYGREVAAVVEVELAVLDPEHEGFPLRLGEVQLVTVGVTRVEHDVQLLFAGLVRRTASVGRDYDLNAAFVLHACERTA